jgi:hypothetical protein
MLESFFARTACWLQRDVDCDCDSRMLSVEHVIPVIDVVHIDIVGSVPDGRPGFWARINHSKPEASELETWGTFDHHDWYVVHGEPVSPAKVSAEAIVRNAVSVITAAFVPGAVLSLPIVRTLALPDVLPHISGSRLGPSHLAQLSITMPAALGSLDCFMLPVFVPLFMLAYVISVVRLSLSSVFVALVLVIFVISLPVLCGGKCRSQ